MQTNKKMWQVIVLAWVVLFSSACVTRQALNQQQMNECQQYKQSLNRGSLSEPDSVVGAYNPCEARYYSNEPTAADFFLFAVFQTAIEVLVHILIYDHH